MIYCGIDWAERTHDVALVDDAGTLVAKRHITDAAAGYKQLLEMLAEHGDTEEAPIPVAIETSRGLLVAVLRTGSRKVYAINPLAAARYRDRHAVSRKKSDPGDALVLANILRTDIHAHRPLAADSDPGRAIAVLARAQQDASWNRQQLANQLRSLLREYYPAALNAIAAWTNGLCRPECRELLKSAPTPTQAARLTRTQLHAALKRAGRQRGIAAEAERLREVLRTEQAHQPPLVEDALGKQMLALLMQLDAACTAADQLAEAVEDAFPQHPDAEIELPRTGRRDPVLMAGDQGQRDAAIALKDTIGKAAGDITSKTAAFHEVTADSALQGARPRRRRWPVRRHERIKVDFNEALRHADEKRVALAADWNMPLRWADSHSEPDAWFVETEWCWYFYYEVATVESEEPEELFGGGPIAVNKDGSEVWLMNSSHPYDQLLAYAEAHGYTVDPAWQ